MKKLVKKEILLETRLFTVSENHIIDPAGHEAKRILVEASGAAVALPVDDQARVLLVKQYRMPALDYLWELPAGKIDPGENELQTAKRELVEETGYRARRWRKLSSFYPSPGFLKERITVFLAEGLTAGERHIIDDEHLEMRWFPVETLERWLRNGKLTDGKTIVGLYAWLYSTRASKGRRTASKVKSS